MSTPLSGDNHDDFQKGDKRKIRYELTANLVFTTNAENKKIAKERLKFWVEGINKTVNASTTLKINKIKCKELPF